jgi:hypothetical protein
MSFTYTAYGLGVVSEIILPELIPGSERQDVIIRRAPIDLPPPQPDQRGVCLFASPSEAILNWDNICAIRVKGGQEIIVNPAPGVEEHVLRLFILGAAFAALLHQCGFLILHASAVAVDGRVAIFLGRSGQGKSTLAAALNDLGHRLMTDDIVAVNFEAGDEPIVFAGFPQIKLWPEVAAALGEVPEQMPQLHPDLEKRALRTIPGFSQVSLPLSKAYVIEESQDPDPEIEDIPPQEALVELVRHTYVARILGRTGTAAAHFKQCSQLVNQVAIRRLKRRRSLPDLPELARIIEIDIRRG